MMYSRTKNEIRERSMLWHLIAFALALTIPIFIFLTGILWKYADSERIQIQDSALAQARAIADDVNQVAAGLIATLQVTATLDSLRQGDTDAIRATLDSIRASTGLAMVLRDSAGTLRAAPGGYEAPRLPPLSPAAPAGGPGNAGAVTVSNYFIDPDTDQPSVAISLPVKVGSHQEGLSLSLIVPTSWLRDIINRTPLPDRWIVAMLDGNGVVLARNLDYATYVGKKGVEELVLKLQQREGTWQGVSLDGSPSFVAFSRSAVTNWQVVIGVRLAELETPLRQSMLIIGLTGVALFSLAIGMAWLIGRRLYQALEDLSESASSVERGDAPSRILTAVKEINIFGQGLALVSRGFQERGVELAASKERLARILDTTPCGIIEVGTDGIVTYANRMQAQLFQMEVSQVVGQHYRDLARPVSVDGGSSPAMDELPLAQALRGDNSVGVEMTFMALDGRPTTVAVNAEPLRTADGIINGALAAFVDVTARVLVDARRRQVEARLRTIVETVPVGIIFAEAPSGRIVEANVAIETILRHKIIDLADPASSRAWQALHEDGRPIAADEYPLARALSGREERPELECNYLRGDDVRRWLKIVGAPLRSEAGTISGAVAAVVDIDDIKRAQEHQQLMNRELHHRVKNTLATIQGIANLTARSATDIKSFRQTFADRIVSLSRTHTLLVENSWSLIPISDLVRLELDPYRAGGHDQVTYEGRDIWLPSDLALALGMAFHELTTNALKFGALSVSTGHVHLHWQTQSEDGKRKLVLDWRESGGPTVRVPVRAGFGSQLLNNILARQLNGAVDLTYEPAGLRARITLDI